MDINVKKLKEKSMKLVSYEELALMPEIRLLRRGKGYRASSINNVLNEKVENPDLLRAIDETINRLEGKKREMNENDKERFLTDDQNFTLKTLSCVISNRRFRKDQDEESFYCFMAESGSGKSFTAKKFAEENKDVLLFRASNKETAKTIIQRIGSKLGATTNRTLQVVFDETIVIMKSIGIRMVIVDEADLLICDHKKGLHLIEFLRQFTLCGIVVVLFALPSLGRMIDLAPASALKNRMRMRVSWESIDSETYSDFVKYIDLDIPAIELSKDIAAAKRDGCLRYFTDLKKNCEMLTRFGNLDPSLVLNHTRGLFISSVYGEKKEK